MTINLFANVLNNDVINNLTPAEVATINAMFEPKAERCPDCGSRTCQTGPKCAAYFEDIPLATETRIRSGKYGPFNQTHRDIDTRWVLNPDDDERVRVTLSTSHSTERKCFTSTLTWGTVRPAEPGSPFQVETWASDHAYLAVHRAPVARYSQKAMEAHHEAALRALLDQWPVARRVFLEAAEQIGVPERY